MNGEGRDQNSKKGVFSFSAGMACAGITLLLFSTGVVNPFGFTLKCPGLGTTTSVSQHLTIQDDLSLLVSKQVTIDSNYKLAGLTFDIGSEREVLKVAHSAGHDYHIEHDLIKTGSSPDNDSGTTFNKGHNEFRVDYLAFNEVTLQDNTAELIWDLTSDRHTVPNERISFSLELPENLEAKDVDVVVYRRSVTSCDKGISIVQKLNRSDNGNRLLLTTDSIPEREMLRAHITWPLHSEPEGII